MKDNTHHKVLYALQGKKQDRSCAECHYHGFEEEFRSGCPQCGNEWVMVEIPTPDFHHFQRREFIEVAK